MPSNPDSRSYLIRFGPYLPPQVSVGDMIQCEIRGLVEVVDWSDRGEMMWPRTRTTRRRALIVTGDLVRAMQNETELAVAELWSVSAQTVMKWKTALKIPARTPGTEAVLSEKSRESMTGRTALPQTKAGLLRAAKRPKSKRWRIMLGARTKLRSLTDGKITTAHDAERTAAMLRMRAEGATLAEIAREIGIAQSSVRSVLERATTRHERTKDRSYLVPRCACGQYSKRHAGRIGHEC
jgi:hypothetical protein